MSVFTGDLHIHSCLSPCGEEDMTPCNIAGMAKVAGLSFVALTDHNSAQNCPAFFEACRAYDLVPIAGMELTTSEDIHLVCLFETLAQALAFEGTVDTRRMPIRNKPALFGHQYVRNSRDEVIEELPLFLPAATGFSLEEASRTVDSLKGVCFPAHIDREANGLLSVLGSFPPSPFFHVVELRDGKNRRLSQGKEVVISSDAHRLWEIGEGEFALYLPARAGDEEGIRRALFRFLRGEV